MIGVLGLVFAWQLFGYVVQPVFSATLFVLHPGVRYTLGAN
jgi:hypothetical protein